MTAEPRFAGLVIRSSDFGQTNEVVAVVMPTPHHDAVVNDLRHLIQRLGARAHSGLVLPTMETVTVCAHGDLLVVCKGCGEKFVPGDRVGDRVILEPLTTGGRPL